MLQNKMTILQYGKSVDSKDCLGVDVISENIVLQVLMLYVYSMY